VFTWFVFYRGARRNETHVRREWLAQRLVEEQAEKLKSSSSVATAFHAVAGTWCEGVVFLSSDLYAVHADGSLDTFIGRSMQNQHFPSLLDPSDQERFTTTLEAASSSKTLQSVPVSLSVDHGKVQAQVVVVDTGVDMPRYIIGLHSIERHLLCSVATGTTRSDPPQGRVDLDDDVASSGADAIASLPSTTGTGNVFADLRALRFDADEDHDVARGQLEEIVQMGTREHWLVAKTDIKISPDRVLGKGGFGVVTMATLRGVPVAAKVPRGAFSLKSFKFFRSVANELRVHRQIRHPNIVAFLGALINPEKFDIALFFELINGGSLQEYARSPMSYHAALKVAINIAAALRYLHQLQPPIVHSDLKPPNILVEAPAGQLPTAKVADMGLSQILTRHSKLLGGTQRWMAPEMRLGDATRVYPSADVFSFGLLMLFVAKSAGKSLPHEGQNGRADVPQEDASYLDQTTLLAKCTRLCSDCTTVEPESRPTMEESQLELLCFLPSEPALLVPYGSSILGMMVCSTTWDEARSKLFPDASQPEPDVAIQQPLAEEKSSTNN